MLPATEASDRFERLESVREMGAMQSSVVGLVVGASGALSRRVMACSVGSSMGSCCSSLGSGSVCAGWLAKSREMTVEGRLLR